MNKQQDKKRKQDLGIFYTPPEVVAFIFEILKIFKDKDADENKRWHLKNPAHYPSVIDPACGEGIFLKKAVDSGFTTPSYIWGVDIDKEVKEKWEKINLLKSFGSKANLDFHFYHQDGLMPVPEKKVGHKKGGMNQYDAVVGNPPYGGMGFSSLKGKSSSESMQILEHLRQFEILTYRKRKNHKSDGQSPLWGDFTWGSMSWGGGNQFPTIKEVESIPIEILFVDRFIQLAKPGGWIAIIIPDGILTNSNSHYVREFISDKTKIEAIVSLPREAFKNVGTSAKTSVLFLKKLKKGEKTDYSYRVFLASAGKIDKSIFETIVKSYEKFYNAGENHMNKSDLIQITKDQGGREAVMVRVDKTLKDMASVKPASRWDPEYWHARYDKALSFLSKTKFSLRRFGDYVVEMTTNNHVKKTFLNEGVRYYQTETVQNTGLFHHLAKRVEESGSNDPKRTRLKIGDIMIIRSGTGSVGRVFTVTNDLGKANTIESVYLTRVSDINPFYVSVFLLTSFGQAELLRSSSGVSGIININRPELEEILIPILSNSIQKSIESEYSKMSAFHEKAMEAKEKGDIGRYRTNLETAEKMLKELIAKTEAVIRGERKDIV